MWRAEARLAWWQLRGSRARALLLIACVAVGVAARVSVGAFTGQLSTALDREARSLLMADVEIVTNQALSDEQQATLQTHLPAGSEVQTLSSCVTMAAAQHQPRSQILMLLAVESGFPFYGSLELTDAAGQPASVDALLSDEPRTYVQRDLLVHLGVEIGDSIDLGATTFEIIGVIEDLPGLAFGGFALGSRALVSREHLASTGLLGYGALSRWRTLIKTPELEEAEPLAAALIKAWDLPEDSRERLRGQTREEEIQVRTYHDAEDQVAEGFERLSEFLRLVALTALLLAGVGIAGVVRAYVAEERDNIALVQVLGASAPRLLRVFMIQLMLLAICGALVGGVVGVLAQGAIAQLAAALLPVAIPFVFDLGALAWGVVLGMGASLVFALAPLLAVVDVKPLVVLRGDAASEPRRLPRFCANAVALVVITGFAMWEGRSVEAGLIFVGLLVAVGLVLAGISALVLPMCAALRHSLPGFGLRHGLGNLVRPGLRPTAAIITLGLASFLLISMLIHRWSIVSEFSPLRRGGMPSLFAINIQKVDVDEVRSFISDHPDATGEFAPMVRARLVSVNDEAITTTDDAGNEVEQRQRHMRRREQRISWRSELGPDEVITVGSWLDAERMYAPDEVAEVSLEEGFAEDIGAELGDVLTFTMQGVEFSARVTSLREVEWAGFRPNFFILISPSVLAAAPQDWVMAVRVTPGVDHLELQTELVRRFPEISVFDVAQVVRKVRKLIDQVVLAVSFLAVFALAAGLVVLVSIAMATGRQRRQEAALLRVLGAGNRTIISALTTEFGIIAGIGVVLGTGLAVVTNALLQEQLFDLPFELPPLWVVATALTIWLAAVIVGVLSCRRVWRVKPLEVLRDD